MGFFLVPYKRRVERRGYARYCAMDDFTPEIVANKGSWAESEIEGNQAVVYVSAPDALLSNIALIHTLVSETDARRALSFTRKQERYDIESDALIFDGKDIIPPSADSIVERVNKETKSSSELTGLISLWAGIGFGLGWRIPYWLAVWGALHIGEPTIFWRAALKMIFDQRGVFPTTGVLDTFTRADEAPLAGDWTQDIFSGDDQIDLSSNQIKGGNGGAWGSAYWDIASFGPDSEAFIEMATEGDGAGTEIFCRIADPTTAGIDNYFAHYTPGTTTFQLYRTVDNTQTQLGATASQAMANGDSIGVEAIGSTIQGYYKAAAGSWASVLSRTDANVTAAGFIGITINSNTARGDNFGGGTVVAATPPEAPTAGQPFHRRFWGIPGHAGHNSGVHA